MNTFFSGTTALDLGISSALAADHAKFAASSGGIGADPQNALALTSFMQRPLDSQNGDSLTVLYDRLTGEVTQGSNRGAQRGRWFPCVRAEFARPKPGDQRRQLG
jgi:flagellar hook-associated protein 1 FlgK